MSGGSNPPAVRGVHGLGNAPMLLASCAFSAGILWARYVWTPPKWIAFGLVLCLAGAAALLVRRSWRSAALAIAAIFALLGGLTWHGVTSELHNYALRGYADNQAVELTGVVLNEPVVSSGMFGGNREAFDLQVETVSRSEVSAAMTGIARLAVYSKGSGATEEEESQSEVAPELLHSGERISLTVKLNVPTNYGNPGAFDYRHYLERQGILVTGSGKAESVRVIARDVLPRWVRWRSIARKSIIDRIHATWPAPQAAVLNAMLIGDASSIGRGVRDDFQRSGTYHILVVSGFNVGILAFVIFWILRRLPTGELAATLITLALAAAYTYLTNAGPPVIRATLMLGVYLITRLLYRDRAALNAVCTAALILLVCDPESLFEPSFQLTFLSVAAIAGLVIPIVDATSGPYHRALRQLSTIGYDASLEPRLAQFRLDLRLLIGRLSRLVGRRIAYRTVEGIAGTVFGFYETLLVSAVMQIALALPMAWYFHRATLTALLANALVVPATALMLPVAIVALGATTISAYLALPLKVATSWLLAFISGSVRFFGGLKVSEARIPSPPPVIAFAAAAAFMVVLLTFRQKRTIVRALGSLLLLTTSILILSGFQHPTTLPTPTLQIISIDVGQGDSFLLISPTGKTLLIDSGGILNGDHANFDVGEDVISPFLWNAGIARLDAVANSHTHVDHAGGMPAVIRNFRPHELWIAHGADSRERRHVLAAAEQASTQVTLLSSSQHFEWGGAQIEVLNPPAEIDFGTKVKDDDALVVRVSYEGRSVLFCGDIGKKGEERVMSHDVHADLLKIAHHGSANATSEEFLRAVHPAYAMISVGRRNLFGHPRPQTLRKLAAGQVRTYRTDLFGATLFQLDRQGVRAMPLARSTLR